METPQMDKFLEEHGDGRTTEDIIQAPDDYLEMKRGEVEKAIELLENYGYTITK